MPRACMFVPSPNFHPHVQVCFCGSCFDQCSVIVVGAVFYDAKPSLPNIIGATVALTSITAYSLVRLPGSTGGIGKSAVSYTHLTLPTKA